MKRILKITLKSDLCTSSGFAFAGIIDADVSYDRFGFPYISGKRLKGCIREAAEYIGIAEADILKIFGKRASSEYEETGGISIYNAYPTSCPLEIPIIDGLYSAPEYGKYFKTESVLGIFTSVQPHTKINEDGTAENNTLRFTRKINHYDPFNKEEMVFKADIEFPDWYCNGTDNRMYKILDNAVRATRNIGMNRNRGLGSVKIEIISQVDSSVQEGITVGSRKRPEVFKKDYSKNSGRVRIRYAVTNTAPVMVGSEKDTVSLDYINGGSVLGAFASLYLSKDGNTPESQEFKDLFLSDKTVFSNLYYAHVIPASDKEEPEIIRYCPVPSYINRLKKSDTLVDIYKYEIARAGNQLADEDAYYGNLPKELEKKFIARVNGKYDVCEVKKEILYHHTKKNKEQLFFFDAISARQQFAGEIIVDEKYAETILGILSEGKLRFGKSRSVQYGNCKVDICIVEGYSHENTVTIPDNSKIRICLSSDAVFMDEEGNYVTDYEVIWKLIKDKIGARDDNPHESCFKTRIVTGYSGKWNLHRPEIPVISAGSSFAFYTKQEITLPEYLGIRINEGFGEYSLVVDDESGYQLEEKRVNTVRDIAGELKSDNFGLGDIYKKILFDRLGEKIRNRVFNDKINISSASLGRLALMAREVENMIRKSTDEYVGAFAAFKSFADRVYSIKRREVREESIRYLTRILGHFPVLSEDSDSKGFKKTSDSDVKVDIIVGHLVKNIEKKHEYEEYARLKDVSQDEESVRRAIFSKWTGLVLEALQFQKYSMKGER